MKKYLWILQYGMFYIVLAIFVLVMIIFSPITFREGSSFFLYQIFFTFLPGLAVFKILNLSHSDVMEESFCGYALGYVLNIIQYFIISTTHILNLLFFVQMAIGIISFGFLTWHSSKEKNHECDKVESKEWWTLVIFLSTVFAIRFVTYYGINILPSSGRGVTFQTQDILFYIGNAISAKQGFPLQDLRFAGQIFKYHYFGSVQLGVTSLVTGIDALRLEVCLEWIQPLILVVSSFYLLMRRMKISLGLRILGMTILLFTAGMELVVYVAYQHIMYKTPFGYDIGLALGVFTLLFLYVQHVYEKISGAIIGTLLTFFGCMGSKAPVALIILFFAGGMCILWLFTPGRKKWAFIYGVPLVFLFLTVFLVVVSDGMNTITTNATGLKFSFTGHLYESGLGKMYYSWTGKGMPGILGKILMMALYYFGCNAVTYFTLLFFSVKYFKRKIKDIFSYEGVMLITICFGLLLTLVTKQQGNSQMYFAMTSFPLASILSMRLWTIIGSRFSKWTGGLFRMSVSLLLVYSIANFVMILAPTFDAGIKKLGGRDDFSTGNNSLTYEEKVAFDWARENLEENAICVTNIILDDNQYESFIVGVCTERPMYMEGWRYVVGYVGEYAVNQRKESIRMFFQGDEDMREKLKEDGVEYVIQVKRYDNVQDNLQSCFGELIYENEGVVLYLID